MPGIDARALRDTLGTFATGVTVIATRTEDGDHGMTANAFMSVSLDPPLITISLDRKCRLLEEIRRSHQYSVSILAEGMEDIATHFAGRHNPELTNIFGDKEGLPVIPDAVAVFRARVVDEIDAGDHCLFIGEVIGMDRCDTCAPLLFHSGKFKKLEAAA